jgi:heterodisulfide reductase subunit C2
MFENVGSRTEFLAGMVQKESGVSVQRCYQCGKCSAGCPAASEMDLKPSVLLRLLQIKTAEADRTVLGSYTIWLCLACHMCIARCPMEIDLPRVMDSLRKESLSRKFIHPKAKDIVAFHTSFLNTIKRFGRLWEVGMIAEYKLRTLHFWQDVVVAPVLIQKGKLSFLPSFHQKFVKRIFESTRTKEENSI